MTPRFPLWMAGLQLSARMMASVSSTTVLDRTWATRIRGGQILGPDSVGYEEQVQSTGAINDIRLAVAYSVRPNFSVGVGLHGFAGENRLRLVRQFDDSLRYGTSSGNDDRLPGQQPLGRRLARTRSSRWPCPFGGGSPTSALPTR